MSEHPIEGLMNTALQNIRQMMDVDTIVGKQITAPDGTIIIPISKVSLGFASGGSDFPSKTDKELFGGGSGAGGTIVPIAFLVIHEGDVRLLPVMQSATPADKAIALVPELFDKITSLFGKGKNKDKAKAAEAEGASEA